MCTTQYLHMYTSRKSKSPIFGTATEYDAIAAVLWLHLDEMPSKIKSQTEFYI